MTSTFEWRGRFGNSELNELHSACFDHPVRGSDWWGRVSRHSLGWVCAREATLRLVGFVNVVWDGADHAFLLDTMVAPDAQRRGIGVRLVTAATDGARDAGCAWLHVDFEQQLRDFYLDACGFRPTAAGLIAL
ncbi:GNAT family N-acetyltransferase [Natronosporangium hydrolyticum]|uniref:GNAT family N-acetyltransferase n=1 Tax=Natronosporangium hydrolyticum TaxID=2811111 RepID=A0A895YLN1_9ACTN|nr:GNAT family N-acetyltransferase [Natronosporangium hydrolyticum]QSB14788.1 GNAT family N-acetyltransferase [Natronosporangium hydrolyticum]